MSKIMTDKDNPNKLKIYPESYLAHGLELLYSNKKEDLLNSLIVLNLAYETELFTSIIVAAIHEAMHKYVQLYGSAEEAKQVANLYKKEDFKKLAAIYQDLVIEKGYEELKD